MIRYTTPTIQLTVEGADLTDNDVYVTLQQGNVKLTKSGEDLTVTTETVLQQTNSIILFTLSQEESASFKMNSNVQVQVNWISASGVRAATEIANIGAFANLLDEVIE